MAAVALSALIPDALHSHHGMQQLAKLEGIWPDFNLESLAETVDREQAEAAVGVRNDFPLSRRVKACVPSGRKPTAFRPRPPSEQTTPKLSHRVPAKIAGPGAGG